jgi:hypothetical protein
MNTGSLNFDGPDPTIQGEIDGGRPIAAEVAWTSGGAHIFGLMGYAFVGDPAVPNVYVQDPFYGASWWEPLALRTA